MPGIFDIAVGQYGNHRRPHQPTMKLGWPPRLHGKRRIDPNYFQSSRFERGSHSIRQVRGNPFDSDSKCLKAKLLLQQQRSIRRKSFACCEGFAQEHIRYYVCSNFHWDLDRFRTCRRGLVNDYTANCFRIVRESTVICRGNVHCFSVRQGNHILLYLCKSNSDWGDCNPR